MVPDEATREPEKAPREREVGLDAPYKRLPVLIHKTDFEKSEYEECDWALVVRPGRSELALAELTHHRYGRFRVKFYRNTNYPYVERCSLFENVCSPEAYKSVNPSEVYVRLQDADVVQDKVDVRKYLLEGRAAQVYYDFYDKMRLIIQSPESPEKSTPVKNPPRQKYFERGFAGTLLQRGFDP